MTERGDAPGPGESGTEPPAAPAPGESRGTPLVPWDQPPAAPPPPPAGVAAPLPPGGLPASSPAPLVAWAPPPASVPPLVAAASGGYAGGPPPFTIGALLADCFAIYAADPIRFIAVSVVTSLVSFLGTFSSNPFDPTGAAAGAAGLLGVLGFVLGIVGGAVMLALADAGPGLAFGRVIRRGVERSGWLFLTSLVLGIGAIVVLIVPLVVIVVVALASPLLAFVLMLVLMLVLIWIGLRVGLAIPATVVDNLNSIDAIKLAWRITAPAGVWARILGAGLLLGLIFVPAFAGLGIAAAVSTLAGQPALLLAFSLGLALFTPIASLLTYAAYRRLVAPIRPWWVEAAFPASTAAGIAAASAIDAPPPSVDAQSAVEAQSPVDAQSPIGAQSAVDAAPPASDVATAAFDAPAVAEPPTQDVRPVFRARPFDAFAKALVVVLLAFDLLGIVAAGWAIGELAAGHVRFPTFPTYPGSPGFPGVSGDAVDPGTVAFGTAADLDTCTVSGQGLAFDSSTPLVWMAAFPRRITPADEVYLHVTLDGGDVETTLQDPGTYDCLGVDVASPFDTGIHGFEVIVNGQVEATGIVFVQ